MGYGRDKAADAVSDGKDALNALFAEVESLREEVAEKAAYLEKARMDLEEANDLLDEAKNEIKRIKEMAFDHLALEIAAEKLAH